MSTLAISSLDDKVEITYEGRPAQSFWLIRAASKGCKVASAAQVVVESGAPGGHAIM